MVKRAPLNFVRWKLGKKRLPEMAMLNDRSSELRAARSQRAAADQLKDGRPPLATAWRAGLFQI